MARHRPSLPPRQGTSLRRPNSNSNPEANSGTALDPLAVARDGLVDVAPAVPEKRGLLGRRRAQARVVEASSQTARQVDPLEVFRKALEADEGVAAHADKTVAEGILADPKVAKFFGAEPSVPLPADTAPLPVIEPGLLPPPAIDLVVESPATALPVTKLRSAVDTWDNIEALPEPPAVEEYDNTVHRNGVTVHSTRRNRRRGRPTKGASESLPLAAAASDAAATIFTETPSLSSMPDPSISSSAIRATFPRRTDVESPEYTTRESADHAAHQDLPPPVVGTTPVAIPETAETAQVVEVTQIAETAQVVEVTQTAETAQVVEAAQAAAEARAADAERRASEHSHAAAQAVGLAEERGKEVIEFQKLMAEAEVRISNAQAAAETARTRADAEAGLRAHAEAATQAARAELDKATQLSMEAQQQVEELARQKEEAAARALAEAKARADAEAEARARAEALIAAEAQVRQAGAERQAAEQTAEAATSRLAQASEKVAATERALAQAQREAQQHQTDAAARIAEADQAAAAAAQAVAAAREQSIAQQQAAALRVQAAEAAAHQAQQRAAAEQQAAATQIAAAQQAAQDAHAAATHAADQVIAAASSRLQAEATARQQAEQRAYEAEQARTAAHQLAAQEASRRAQAEDQVRAATAARLEAERIAAERIEADNKAQEVSDRAAAEAAQARHEATQAAEALRVINTSEPVPVEVPPEADPVTDEWSFEELQTTDWGAPSQSTPSAPLSAPEPADIASDITTILPVISGDTAANVPNNDSTPVGQAILVPGTMDNAGGALAASDAESTESQSREEQLVSQDASTNEDHVWTAAELSAQGWTTADLKGAGWTDEHLQSIGWAYKDLAPTQPPVVATPVTQTLKESKPVAAAKTPSTAAASSTIEQPAFEQKSAKPDLPPIIAPVTLPAQTASAQPAKPAPVITPATQPAKPAPVVTQPAVTLSDLTPDEIERALELGQSLSEILASKNATLRPSTPGVYASGSVSPATAATSTTKAAGGEPSPESSTSGSGGGDRGADEAGDPDPAGSTVLVLPPVPSAPVPAAPTTAFSVPSPPVTVPAAPQAAQVAPQDGLAETASTNNTSVLPAAAATQQVAEALSDTGEGDVERVEYRPGNSRRFIFGAGFLAAAVLSVVAVFWAINSPGVAPTVTACCLIVLTGAFWWALVAWSPRIISIGHGVLEFAQGGHVERFNLLDPDTAITVGTDTASRAWRTEVVRPNGTKIVIGPDDVRPQQFSAIIAKYRSGSH